MTVAHYLLGDTRKVMSQLPDGCVDLVLTSPPFLALRSYLPADHPDKGSEIGSEPTPAAFLDTLLDCTDEWARLLAPHGTLAVELGDTYAGSGGAGGDYGEGGLRDGQGKFDGSGRRNRPADVAAGILAPTKRPGPEGRDRMIGWPLDKSLTLVPELYRLALAYGRNPLTGREVDRWRVRNVVRWVRPNPPVGALCVDDRTEALTPDGWKRHDELADGDLIAAYDKASDSCRWLPAKFVRYHRENEPMVAIEKRKTSQRLTAEHRCLVRTAKRPDPFVVLAGDLTNEQQVLLSAPLEDVPGPEPVTVERAELLGWFITEGSPLSAHRCKIVQSLTANGPKVARIRSLLERDGADFTERNYRRTSGTYGGTVLTTFTIKGELAQWLMLHHKRLPMQYVTTWPTRSLRALWNGLIDGDGHRRRSGGYLFFQKERQVCDAVQVLALRLGLRASVTRQDRMDGWQVTVGAEEHVESSRWTKVRKWDSEGIPREFYTGTVWCPMVETGFWLARRNGLTFITGNSDKFRPATSDLVVACKARDRWFDLDTVRTATTPDAIAKDARSLGRVDGHERARADVGLSSGNGYTGINPAGAPPLDWWKISPGGYSGSHYAVFPPELLERPIEAMCPRRVCRTCGKPSRREVAPSEQYDAERCGGDFFGKSNDRTIGTQRQRLNGRPNAEYLTTGWSSCGCPGTDGIRLDGYHTGTGWRPGRVLDPFGGTGTTGLVATGRGRDAVLIDLDDRNLDLARERLGMFLNPTTPDELADLFGEAS